MPHIANIPWIFLYFSLILCLFIIQSALSFTAKQINNLNPNNFKIININNTNWNW